MIIIRKYKRIDWFDFIELIEKEFSNQPPKQLYFDFQDELRMRVIESVSEGASFKFKAHSKKIMECFKERMQADPSFASSEDYNEFLAITEQI